MRSDEVASPDDTSTLFQYAQIAQYAGDSTTALAGYKKSLKLAPDDPQAAVAKQAIKSLAPPGQFVRVVRENQLQAGILGPAQADPAVVSAPT